jgi:hypothetical protein
LQLLQPCGGRAQLAWEACGNDRGKAANPSVEWENVGESSFLSWKYWGHPLSKWNIGGININQPIQCEKNMGRVINAETFCLVHCKV